MWCQAVDKCWSNMAWYKSGWNLSSNVLKCQEAQPPSPRRTQHMHPHARATSCPWCLHDDFKKKTGFCCIQMQVSHIIWKWFTMQQCVGCVIWFYLELIAYNPVRYYIMILQHHLLYRDETMIIDVFALESWRVWELFTSHHLLGDTQWTGCFRKQPNLTRLHWQMWNRWKPLPPRILIGKGVKRFLWTSRQ